jgi:glycosyltransferase involved in cell wall biosynthesis
VKVLVVLAQPPAPEGNAPGRCAHALLAGLALHGVEVHALAAVQRGDDRPSQHVGVELVEAGPSDGAFARFARLHRPRGALVGAFSERVRELADAFDVVHLEETDTAWCDVGIRRPSSLHMHFRTSRDRPLPAPWRHEFRFYTEFAAAELVAARRHRYLVANSSVVADSLRRVNRKADVVVVPLTLEPSHYRRASLEGPPLAGLIGTGDWPPTTNAISRLVHRVWPLVRRRVPEARLLVAGRATSSLVVPGAVEQGVEFLGEVPSGADFVAGLSLLLYPVERGSGMKVKVLEALASGVPVVTTRDGAEGIAPTPGVVVAGSDEELAVAAADILRDAGERVERGAAGRSMFVECYSPRPATLPLVELFELMATESGR